MFKAKFNYLSFKRVFKWKIHLTQITCKMNWKWNRKREELEELKEEEEEDKKQTANELNLKWIKLPSLHLYTRSVCIIGTDIRIELQSKNSVSISLIRLVLVLSLSASWVFAVLVLLLPFLSASVHRLDRTLREPLVHHTFHIEM